MNKKRSTGFGNVKQLFQFCLALVITALLFNASGIHEWAKRLEIGNEYVPREALVELTGHWESLIEVTGLNRIRQSVMAYRDLKDHPHGAESANLNHDKLSNNESSESGKPVVEAKKDDLVGNDQVSGHSVSSEGKVSTESQLPNVIAGANSETYIALVGDSMMAVGLAPHLTRMIEKNSLGKVVRAYKSGTGLARPDVFNWLNEYPKMVGNKNPSIIICAIGANDGQGIEVNKKPLAFGSPAWEEEYARRVGSFSELLLKNGAKVYWVLLPHMRAQVYDQKMQNLNNFLQMKFKDVPNLVFISPDSMIAGRAVNAYIESAQINGKQERLRADDGIHLSDSGARNLAIGILKTLQ